MHPFLRANLMRWFGRECKLRDIDPTTIDFEAIVDSTLTYQENKQILLDELRKVASLREGAAPRDEEEIFAEYETKIARLEAKNARLEALIAGFRKVMETRPAEYMHTLCRVLGLPLKVKRETWKLYQKSNPHGPVQQETIPALVWLASRKHGIPLPHRKVAELALMDRRTFSSRCWRLVKKLDLRFQPLNPRELLSSAGQRLSLPEKVLERARAIL